MTDASEKPTDNDDGDERKAPQRVEPRDTEMTEQEFFEEGETQGNPE